MRFLARGTTPVRRVRRRRDDRARGQSACSRELWPLPMARRAGTICSAWRAVASTTSRRLLPRRRLALKHHIDRLCTAHPFYGSRRIAAALGREGMSVNGKAVQRHMPRARHRRRCARTPSEHARTPVVALWLIRSLRGARTIPRGQCDYQVKPICPGLYP